MKALLIITSLILSSLLLFSNNKNIGVILDGLDSRIAANDVLVEYEYDGKETLILTFKNIRMNGGAQGITGATMITEDNIFIKPVESYGKDGPSDSRRFSSIQYVIKKVDPIIYTLTHDDSELEGDNRILKIRLDLSKAVKNKTTVTFKEHFLASEPYGVPNEKNTKLDHKAPDFDSIKTWLRVFEGKSKNYIYEYFGENKIKSSTWNLEDKDQLLLTVQYKEFEMSFYFSDDKVVFCSFMLND